ncbi:apolipophorin short isoform [Plakobranchus ocellatus]|uniref:Apolipophorin short isoform n=1 Tax=Plakobranchus ocellatus TaxID=259542 RepID=A0AAV4AVP1_9GAST|nr:apolipophorin short isoform [Plakobranchus ocellatus]
MGGASKDNPQLSIKSDVRIDVLGRCEMALRLQNSHLEISNERGVLKKVKRDQLIQFNQALRNSSLRFSYKDGQIEHICLEGRTKDPPWVLNFKKGILSAFQNGLTQWQDDKTTTENDISGECKTQYSILQNGHHAVSVRKTKSIMGCRKRQQSGSSLFSVPYEIDSEIRSMPLMNVSYECTQTLGKDGILHRTDCVESHFLRPLSQGKKAVSVTVRQSLVYTKHRKERRKYKSSVKTRQPLTFDFSENEVKSNRTRFQVERILRKLCQSTEDDVRPETPQMFYELVSKMKLLDRIDLSRVHHLLKTIDLCSTNTITLELFLDALPAVASRAALRLMTSLLTSGDVTGARAKMWLTSLAFISAPTSSMLKEVQSLLHHESTRLGALLPVSALIHNFCRHHGQCSRHQGVADLVTLIEEGVGSSCDGGGKNTEEVLLSLRALGNVGFVASAAELINKCMANASYPLSLRVAAAQSFRRMPCQDQRRNDKHLWEVFTTSKNDSELRVTAYLSIMRCANLTVVRDIVKELHNMAAQADPNETNVKVEGRSDAEVISFATSHLRNMLNSASPHKQSLRQTIKSVNLSTFETEDLLNMSKNYEYSAMLKRLNAGLTAEGNVLWSGQQSPLPRSLTANLTVELFGDSLNLLDIGWRLEGFEKHLKSAKEAYKHGEFLHWLKKRIGKDVEGHVFARVFGNEILFLRLPEIVEMVSGWTSTSVPSRPKDVWNWLSGRHDYSLTRAMQVVDKRMTLPTISGLPIHLTLYGSAAVDLRLKGNLDLWKVTSKSRSLKIAGECKASGAMEIVAGLSLDASVTKVGLRMRSRVHTSAAINGRVQLEKGHNFRQPVILFLISSKKSIKAFVIRGDKEKQIHESSKSHRPNKQFCTGNNMASVSGLELCAEFKSPAQAQSDYRHVLLNGPMEIGVTLHKTDRQTGYEFSSRLKKLAAKLTCDLQTSARKLVKSTLALSYSIPKYTKNNIQLTTKIQNKSKRELMKYSVTSTLNVKYNPDYDLVLSLDLGLKKRQDDFDLQIRYGNDPGDLSKKLRVRAIVKKHIRSVRKVALSYNIYAIIPLLDLDARISGKHHHSAKTLDSSITLHHDYKRTAISASLENQSKRLRKYKGRFGLSWEGNDYVLNTEYNKITSKNLMHVVTLKNQGAILLCMKTKVETQKFKTKKIKSEIFRAGVGLVTLESSALLTGRRFEFTGIAKNATISYGFTTNGTYSRKYSTAKMFSQLFYPGRKIVLATSGSKRPGKIGGRLDLNISADSKACGRKCLTSFQADFKNKSQEGISKYWAEVKLQTPLAEAEKIGGYLKFISDRSSNIANSSVYWGIGKKKSLLAYLKVNQPLVWESIQAYLEMQTPLENYRRIESEISHKLSPEMVNLVKSVFGLMNESTGSHSENLLLGQDQVRDFKISTTFNSNLRSYAKTLAFEVDHYDAEGKIKSLWKFDHDKQAYHCGVRADLVAPNGLRHVQNFGTVMVTTPENVISASWDHKNTLTDSKSSLRSSWNDEKLMVNVIGKRGGWDKSESSLKSLNTSMILESTWEHVKNVTVFINHKQQPGIFQNRIDIKDGVQLLRGEEEGQDPRKSLALSILSASWGNASADMNYTLETTLRDHPIEAEADLSFPSLPYTGNAFLAWSPVDKVAAQGTIRSPARNDLDLELNLTKTNALVSLKGTAVKLSNKLISENPNHIAYTLVLETPIEEYNSIGIDLLYNIDDENFTSKAAMTFGSNVEFQGNLERRSAGQMKAFKSFWQLSSPVTETIVCDIDLMKNQDGVEFKYVMETPFERTGDFQAHGAIFVRSESFYNLTADVRLPAASVKQAKLQLHLDLLQRKILSSVDVAVDSYKHYSDLNVTYGPHLEASLLIDTGEGKMQGLTRYSSESFTKNKSSSPPISPSSSLFGLIPRWLDFTSAPVSKSTSNPFSDKHKVFMWLDLDHGYVYKLTSTLDLLHTPMKFVVELDTPIEDLRHVEVKMSHKGTKVKDFRTTAVLISPTCGLVSAYAKSDILALTDFSAEISLMAEKLLPPEMNNWILLVRNSRKPEGTQCQGRLQWTKGQQVSMDAALKTDYSWYNTSRQLAINVSTPFENIRDTIVRAELCHDASYFSQKINTIKVAVAQDQTVDLDLEYHNPGNRSLSVKVRRPLDMYVIGNISKKLADDSSVYNIFWDSSSPLAGAHKLVGKLAADPSGNMPVEIIVNVTDSGSQTLTFTSQLMNNTAETICCNYSAAVSLTRPANDLDLRTLTHLLMTPHELGGTAYLTYLATGGDVRSIVSRGKLQFLERDLNMSIITEQSGLQLYAGASRGFAVNKITQRPFERKLLMSFPRLNLTQLLQSDTSPKTGISEEIWAFFEDFGREMSEAGNNLLKVEL